MAEAEEWCVNQFGSTVLIRYSKYPFLAGSVALGDIQALADS